MTRAVAVLLLIPLLAGCAQDQANPTDADADHEVDPQTDAPPAPAKEKESPPAERGSTCSLRSESNQQSQRVRTWNCSQPDGIFHGKLDGCESFERRQMTLGGKVEAGALRIRVYTDDLIYDRTLDAGESGSTQPVDLEGSAWTAAFERDAAFDAGPGFNISLLCYR